MHTRLEPSGLYLMVDPHSGLPIHPAHLPVDATEFTIAPGTTEFAPPPSLAPIRTCSADAEAARGASNLHGTQQPDHHNIGAPGATLTSELSVCLGSYVGTPHSAATLASRFGDDASERCEAVCCPRSAQAARQGAAAHAATSAGPGRPNVNSDSMRAAHGERTERNSCRREPSLSPHSAATTGDAGPDAAGALGGGVYSTGKMLPSSQSTAGARSTDVLPLERPRRASTALVRPCAVVCSPLAQGSVQRTLSRDRHTQSPQHPHSEAPGGSHSAHMSAVRRRRS